MTRFTNFGSRGGPLGWIFTGNPLVLWVMSLWFKGGRVLATCNVYNIFSDILSDTLNYHTMGHILSQAQYPRFMVVQCKVAGRLVSELYRPGAMLNVLGGWGAVFTWTQIFRYTRKGTDQMDVDQMTSPFEQFLDWCAFVLILAEEKKNEKMKINIQIWHFTALQHPKSYANNFLYLRGVFPNKAGFFHKPIWEQIQQQKFWGMSMKNTHFKFLLYESSTLVLYKELSSSRQPIAVSDISVYICLIDIRDGSCKPVYGGVDHLKALSSAKTGCRPRFFMN